MLQKRSEAVVLRQLQRTHDKATKLKVKIGIGIIKAPQERVTPLPA
jgi:hypothetical protein